VLFECEQWVPASRDGVFRFFSEASNLQRITPPWLHFKVVTPTPIPIGLGTVIDYRLRVHGIPIRWQSVIPIWEPPIRFVDEQRRGPYTRWVHTHTFIDDRGGTMVKDSVVFDVPFVFVAGWFVMRDVRQIFAYRRQRLVELFGS
jgi:ligand-binding SRPBCC domain-containing protein